jgi:hypothetical protein
LLFNLIDQNLEDFWTKKERKAKKASTFHSPKVVKLPNCPDLLKIIGGLFSHPNPVWY